MALDFVRSSDFAVSELFGPTWPRAGSSGATLPHNDDGDGSGLEQRKSVWLQPVQDGHASHEQH